MTNFLKKALALALTLCTVLSLCVPAVSAEETAEEYVFPEWSDPVELGIPLQGELSTREHAVKFTRDGKDYLLICSRAGTVYIFKLTDYLEGADNKGTWIERSFNYGTSAHGIVVDSKGVIYLAGGDVMAYDPASDSYWSIQTPLSGIAYGIAVDEDDNLYVARENAIIKIETTYYTSQIIYQTDEISYSSTVAAGGGYVYVSGKKTGGTVGMEIHKVDMKTGAKVAEITYDKSSTLYYMSYVDGVIFGGHSATVPDGMICFDTATMQPLDIGVDSWIMGLVTEPTEDGKCYFQASGQGVWEYDIATRKASRVEGLISWSTNLRIQDPYIDVSGYEGISGKCILTVASGGATPALLSLEGKGFVTMEDLVVEGVSPAQVRSVVSGIPGLMVNDPDDEEGTPAAEVAVYVGGYLASRVGRYSPDMEEEDRIESEVFSQGRAQTDAMITYQNKIYGGSYSGGYLWEFDPATGVHTELIHGMLDPYYQARVHGLTAGDNKIFFSTVPYTGALGGCLGWYNLETGEWEFMERNLVEDQIFISIYYDEETDLLYAASSVHGGSKSTPTQKEAVIMVYDVAAKKKLGEFSVRAGVNPDSDMVFDLENGAAIPQYISCVTRDPNTGKFWGMVSNTLFSFEYDKSNNTLKVHEEVGISGYTNLDKGRYVIAGSLQWFERPILFDGNGYMYANFEAAGYIQRLKVSDPTDHQMITKTTGKIAIGSDGNLYIGSGDYLYQVALNRVDIVKAMIDGTEPKDKDGVAEARLAYESLTEDEQTQVGETYYKALAALEGATVIFQQVAAEKTDKLIDSIGVVTVTSYGNILAARNAYNGLDEQEKAMVTKYDDLVAAEQAYAAISAKIAYGAPKDTTVSFSLGVNPRAVGVDFKEVKYDHITGGIWEYACGSGKWNQGARVQMSFGAEGTGYLGVRVKITEAGLYDLTADTQAYASGGIGAVYLFSAAGMDNETLYEQVKSEVTACKVGSEHYIGTVDYTVTEVQTVGQWYCETPGEYILAFGRRETKGGDYARLNALTFSKQNPATDEAVELAKNRINAIGKVTKNSGSAINEARITYDALTTEQKTLIYAPQLEAAETAYAEIAAQAAVDEAAVAVVEIQINAIGEVSISSGNAIQTARDAYDALTKDQQKMVSNYDVLKDAEKAYKTLTGDTDDDTTQQPDNTVTVIIAAVAVVLLAAAIIAVILVKKRRAGACSHLQPSAESSAEETLEN